MKARKPLRPSIEAYLVNPGSGMLNALISNLIVMNEMNKLKTLTNIFVGDKNMMDASLLLK